MKSIIEAEFKKNFNCKKKRESMSGLWDILVLDFLDFIAWCDFFFLHRYTLKVASIADQIDYLVIDIYRN